MSLNIGQRIERPDLDTPDAVRTEVATTIMTHILEMKPGDKVTVECLADDGDRMFNIKAHRNKEA
jgi:hypothetical protein